MRKLTLLATIGAVVMVGAAAGVRFAVLPAVHRIPANLDTTVNLTGTADLLDEAAMRSGDLAHAVRTGVPINARERIQVIATEGRIAMIVDETTTGTAEQALSTSRHVWSVDRTTLDAMPAPAGASTHPHEGLVVGFPLSPQPRDYPYWDVITDAPATAHYLRPERHGNRDTYVYQVKAGGPVLDTETLATLPRSLSREALLAFGTTLEPTMRDLLASVSGLLPAQIPLTYTAASDTTYWIDTNTGYVIDLTREQTITATPPNGFTGLSLPTTFTIKLRYSPDSVAQASDGAATAQRGVYLIGTVAPWSLLGVAVLLVLLALWSLTRRSRPATAG